MNFYKRKRRMPTVIIVSLIDIFAILLIFVIVTTTFKRVQPSVVIKLPEVNGEGSASKTQAGSPVLLTITPDERVFLNQEPIKIESLEPAVRRVLAGGQRIALNADKKAPFGIVLRVMEALKRAGVSGSVPAFTENIKKGT